MSDWRLSDAKARLSALVKLAVRDGPQRITVHGKPMAVVLSQDDYQKLTAGKPSFTEFMAKSPLAGSGLQIERDRLPISPKPR